MPYFLMVVFVNEFIFVCFVVVNEYFTMKKCDICFKEFKNDHGVRIHKGRMHTGTITNNSNYYF